MTYAIQRQAMPQIVAVTNRPRAAAALARRLPGAIVRCFNDDRSPVGVVHYRHGRRVAVCTAGPDDIERMYQERLELVHGLVYL